MCSHIETVQRIYTTDYMYHLRDKKRAGANACFLAEVFEKKMASHMPVREALLYYLVKSWYAVE